MKKQKSQNEALIQSFLFAVYPFSILFSDPKDDQFSIYFQKNVQILTKFQLRNKVFPSNKLIYFPPPDNIQPFRILSQKGLTYKWSLYHLVGTNEEHIESEDFDLSAFWRDFIARKEDVKPFEIVFKKTKCKFFCLVGVGTLKSMLLNFTQYFQMASSDIIKRPRLAPHPLQNQLSLNSNMAQQNSAISNKRSVMKGSKGKEGESEKQSQLSLGQVKLFSKDSTINKIMSSPVPLLAKTSSRFVQEKKIQQKPIRLGSKVGGSFLSVDQGHEISSGNGLNSVPKPLSNQQIQIANQIESKIEQLDQFNSGTNSKMLSLHRGPSSGDEMLKIYCLRKSSKLTGSQRLNGKGEIIVTPFYYHLKYYLIIILILIIFIGLILHNPQSKPPHESHVNIRDLHNRGKKKGGHSALKPKYRKKQP